MMSPFVVLILTVEVSGERAAIVSRIGGQVGKEVGKVVSRHAPKVVGELEGATTKLFGEGAEEAAPKLLGDIEGPMSKQWFEARNKMSGLDPETRAQWYSYLGSLPAGAGYTQWPAFNEPPGKDGNMKPMGSGPEGTPGAPALDPYGKAKTTEMHTRDTTTEWKSPFGGTYGSNQGSFLPSASSGGSSNYGSGAGGSSSSSGIFQNPSSSSSSSSSSGLWSSGSPGGFMSRKALCNVPVGTQIQWGSETECLCGAQTCIRFQHYRCDSGRCNM